MQEQQNERPEVFEKMAELLDLFGDTTRIRIISQLLESERCVSEIAGNLNMTTSAISHQLRILKQGRLIKSRKEGKTVFYSLADSHVRRIYSLALEHVLE